MNRTRLLTIIRNAGRKFNLSSTGYVINNMNKARKMVQHLGMEAIGEGNGVNSPLILIKADNLGVTTVTSLLKTINFCEKVNVFVSAAGIRFIVEEGRYVQAGVLFKSELFRTFNCNEELVGFKIPFKELLDCLKILGGDSKSSNITNDTVDGVGAPVGVGSSRSMQITYSGYGSPFALSLEENGMITEIELRTEEEEVITDYDGIDRKWDITMDSRLLHEYLFELEGYSPENVTIRVVPDSCLQFRATGAAGSLKISIPKTCGGIERFCSVANQESARYKFSILRHSFKMIHAAEKVVLQMGDNEVLSIRLIFKETMGTTCEFHVVPLVENMDENELDD
ncbi:Cell cycle checkpoint protein RAD1 [Orchesella cincta]|uniref:Cell cycle checkpoint protein RAD1 n=1 Tax=Orchesella cincta TaxID=48709 RepID=A0A1D2NBQ6_ORCCI|nr:Cell cycle checkpoint protein RAD1 [Orchesella cincta]